MRGRTMGWLVAGSILVSMGCGQTDPLVAARDGTLESPYLVIADTLASDRLDHLPQLGALVLEALQSRPNTPGAADLSRGAARVGAQDIDTARDAFRTMSLGMIEHLAAQPEHREGRMLVHCPMAFEGAGARWVQPRGAVRNPYEGAMMLHCGNLVAWDEATAPTE